MARTIVLASGSSRSRERGGRPPGVVRGLALGVLTSLLVAVVAQPATAAVARDDTETVCKNAATTVNNALPKFAEQMQHVSDQASAQDLVGAEASLKQAGAILQDTSAQLTQQGANADDPKVKQGVNDLAGELNSLSAQLTTLSGLQSFDTTRLGQLARTMSQLCGPAASFPAPPESGAPNRTAAPSRTS